MDEKHIHSHRISDSARVLILPARLFICQKTHTYSSDVLALSWSVVYWHHCSEALKVC